MDQGDHITYKFQTVHPHHFNCTKCRWVTECVCVCVFTLFGNIDLCLFCKQNISLQILFLF